MPNRYLPLFHMFVDWADCVRSPMNTCRHILNSAISDKEKINYTFRIWIVAFLLSFSLELPLYLYYGTRNDYLFYILYILIGFILFFISSCVIHVILRLFGINSIYTETLISYTFAIVAYSPLLLLILYQNVFANVQLIRTIKTEHIDMVNNLSKLKDIIIRPNQPTIFIIISNINTLFSLILQCVTGVLLSYMIMERYNSNKFKSILAITCAQITMIFPLILPAFIKELILYNFIK